MLVGRVVGHVWSTVKWPALAGTTLLVVQPFEHAQLVDSGGTLPEAAPGNEDGIVVADTLDAGVGDVVVVAFGHAARVAVAETAAGEAPPHPIDAAVVAIVDGMEVSA